MEVVVEVEASEREGNKGSCELFFFPALCSEILLSFSLFSLPAEPSRSLARSSPHTRRDMSRASAARSALRALAATATGAGAAAPVSSLLVFFMEFIFFRFSLARLLCSPLRQRNSLLSFFQ